MLAVLFAISFGGPIINPAWKLAYVKDDNIYVTDGLGRYPIKIVDNADRPTWSPDRKRLAFVRKGDVWVCRADGTGQHQLSHVDRDLKNASPEARRDIGSQLYWEPVPLTWHPSLPMIVFGRWGLYSIRTDHADAAHLLIDAGEDEDTSDVDFPCFNRDGSRLYFEKGGDIYQAVRTAAKSGRVWAGLPGVWRTQLVGEVATHDPKPGDNWSTFARNLSVSPDGKLIAYSLRRMGGTGVAQVRLLDLATGKNPLLVDEALDPCFSPDGKWVLCRAGADMWDERPLMAISIDGKWKKTLVAGAEQGNW